MAVELKPQQSRNPDMMQTSADLVTDPYSQESTYRGPLWQHDDWFVEVDGYHHHFHAVLCSEDHNLNSRAQDWAATQVL